MPFNMSVRGQSYIHRRRVYTRFTGAGDLFPVELFGD